jgi:hypothetical protein
MIQFIGICGAPTAGKSEVQTILESEFAAIPIDDSRPLRDAVKFLYGLSEEDVSTQKGKRRLVPVGGDKVPVRKLIGEVGLHVEERDPNHLPRLAREKAEAEHPGKLVSFGSIRMSQGQIFQDDKSLVIEVVRPGAVPINKFDEYDPSLAHITILNDYDPEDPKGSFLRLTKNIHEKIGPILAS